MSCRAEQEAVGPFCRFVVGNTYQLLSRTEAKLNRNGTRTKIHDWVLYVDIIDGDPGIIHYVKFDLPESFHPSTFTCYSPVRTTVWSPSPSPSSPSSVADDSYYNSTINSNSNTTIKRFKTRQQSAKGLTAAITIVGSGGSIVRHKYKLVLNGHGGRSDMIHTFTEERPIRPVAMAPLSPNHSFAIEMELSCSSLCCTLIQAAKMIYEESGFNVLNVEDFGNAHEPVNSWKLQHDEDLDGMLEPQDDCRLFELVSPVLTGNAGVEECSFILRALERLGSDDCVYINKSFGFHVDIDVSSLTLDSIIKICQNFIKYEDAIDSMMPLSRRTAGYEYNQFFYSNKLAMLRNGENCNIDESQDTKVCNNAKRHKALSSCCTIEELIDIMNPERQKYYKLNLQNLKPKKSQHKQQQIITLQFRQHYLTTSVHKVHAWIAFCMAFVHNSARLKAPSYLKESRSLDDQFDFLFEYVIKDRAIEQFYRRRRDDILRCKEDISVSS